MSKTIKEQVALAKEVNQYKGWFSNGNRYYSEREVLDLNILSSKQLDKAYQSKGVYSFSRDGIRFFEERSILKYAGDIILRKRGKNE